MNADGKALIYACSGCSDVGELADRIARRLQAENLGEMSCLAGVAGRVQPLFGKAQKAERILVIDGCPLNCGRKTLQLAGLAGFHQLQLNDLGFKKNRCPITAERIACGCRVAVHLLNSEFAAREEHSSPGAAISEAAPQ